MVYKTLWSVFVWREQANVEGVFYSWDEPSGKEGRISDDRQTQQRSARKKNTVQHRIQSQSNDTQFQQKTLVWAEGVTVEVFVLGWSCDANKCELASQSLNIIRY